MDYSSFQPGGQNQNRGSISSFSVKKNFTPKFIGAIVLLLVVGGVAYGGIWWWGNKNSQVAVPAVTPDPTAGWRTYTNTQYGFEIKYPNNFVSLNKLQATGGTPLLDVGQHDQELGYGTYIIIRVVPLSSNQSCDASDYTSRLLGGSNDNLQKEEVKINNTLSAWRVFYKVPPPGTSGDEFYVSPGNCTGSENHTLVDVKTGSGPLLVYDSALVMQIISTFKFIDSTDTSTWKTYTNTKYGFNIKYPADWKVVDNGGDVISVCKDCVSTLSQHINSTQISIFPEGLGTEGPAGESRKVNLNLTQAQEKLVSDFYLSNNNQTWGYYISFSPVPAHWETFGYIWASVEVTNKTTEETPTEGMPIVKLNGQVSASDFNLVKQILSTFKFTK